MVIVHKINVEEEALTRTNFCAICNFKTRKMNEFREHMISNHNKEGHNWWTEAIRAEYYCDICEVEFTKKVMLISHMEKDHDEGHIKPEDNPVKSEYYDIKNFPDNKEESEDEDVNKAYGRKKEVDQTDIIMKGRSQAFKDANVVLKSKLTKGMVLTD